MLCRNVWHPHQVQWWSHPWLPLQGPHLSRQRCGTQCHCSLPQRQGSAGRVRPLSGIYIFRDLKSLNGKIRMAPICYSRLERSRFHSPYPKITNYVEKNQNLSSMALRFDRLLLYPNSLYDLFTISIPVGRQS